MRKNITAKILWLIFLVLAALDVIFLALVRHFAVPDFEKGQICRLFAGVLLWMLVSKAAALLTIHVFWKTRLLGSDRMINGKTPDDSAAHSGEIERSTREEQQQQSELDIAARLQMGMLPPARFEKEDISVHAVMFPAKQVGGDFYDYFPIGSDLLFTVIADVSGKGITGAMLMSKTITVIRHSAHYVSSPAEILRQVNELLSENNPEQMFVTAFIGVYDRQNGTYTYSNAGHNPPFLFNGQIGRLSGAHGMALGLFDDEEYEEEVIRLLPGDQVFLYTDGVSEAVDPDKAFFGEERIRKALSRLRWGEGNRSIKEVNRDLMEFQQDAEQFDDITMLSFMPLPKEGIFLKAETQNTERIFSVIREWSELSPKMIRRLCFAAEEIFVNICSYAYGEKGGFVLFSLSVDDGEALLRFTDTGTPFNPLENQTDIDSYDMDTQVGGLGRYLTIKRSDGADYVYTDNKNILTIKMKREGT